MGKWTALHANQIPIGQGALVACANGVGYFTAGWKVAKLLTVAKALLRGTGHPVLAFITGMAQHSAQYFLKLPGCRAMTPGSDWLESVAAVEPTVQRPTYLPVIGDFAPRSLKGAGLFRRWGARGLDLLIMPILGRRHDWVVGTRRQAIMPPRTYARGFDPKRFTRHMLAARHSDYFYARHTDAQKMMDRFFR